MSNAENPYRQILSKLKESVPQIKAITLVNRSGELIENILPSSCDLEVAGMVTLSTNSIVEETIRELNRTQAKQIFIKGKSGFVLLRQVMDKAILLLFTEHQVQLNSLWPQVDETIELIATQLKSS